MLAAANIICETEHATLVMPAVCLENYAIRKITPSDNPCPKGWRNNMLDHKIRPPCSRISLISVLRRCDDERSMSFHVCQESGPVGCAKGFWRAQCCRWRPCALCINTKVKDMEKSCRETMWITYNQSPDRNGVKKQKEYLFKKKLAVNLGAMVNNVAY